MFVQPYCRLGIWNRLSSFLNITSNNNHISSTSMNSRNMLILKSESDKRTVKSNFFLVVNLLWSLAYVGENDMEIRCSRKIKCFKSTFILHIHNAQDSGSKMLSPFVQPSTSIVQKVILINVFIYFFYFKEKCTKGQRQII